MFGFIKVHMQCGAERRVDGGAGGVINVNIHTHVRS